MFTRLSRMFFSVSALCVPLCAHLPTEADTIRNRERIDQLTLPQCLAIPEGDFVYYFHPTLGQWLEKKFDLDSLREICALLEPHLQIPLTEEGFSMASTRREEREVDTTGYSAIWVRDCAWHYYGLKLSHPARAKRLMLSLLNFYASEGQRARFVSVIDNPNLADPTVNPKAHMSVPLIRFSRQTLSHHQINSEDQEWCHLQFDSHGLFLLTLADALESGLVLPEELEPKHYEVLALLPIFFAATDFANRGDAGPWEEELLLNASSAGLIASGLKRMHEVIQANVSLQAGFRDSFSIEKVDPLYQAGVERVERNLAYGGEAPDHSNFGNDRGADVALFFLCLSEHSLYYNDPAKIREILNINSRLIGPYGIYRYHYDAYQAANYWIDHNILSAIEGPKTLDLNLITRFGKGYMPHNQVFDAQWFFDSNIASLYYRLVVLLEDPQAKAYYLRKGDIHLKRALGQITGPATYAANGEKTGEWQLPESINTVIDGWGRILPAPSPICPLSWAKAGLIMALDEAQTAHAIVGGL